MNCSWGYKTDGMVTIGMPFDRRFYLIRPDLGLNRNNLSKEDFIVTQDVALAIKLEKPDNVAIGSNTDDDVDAVISSVVFFLSLVFFLSPPASLLVRLHLSFLSQITIHSMRSHNAVSARHYCNSIHLYSM